MRIFSKILFFIALPLACSVEAQSYSIDFYKIAGGGGNSSGTNGSTVYTVSGTIGQPDASTAMTGGTYSLIGGFWSLIAVPTPGAPLLSIAQSGATAVISWVYPSTGFILQTNGNLASTNWVNYTGLVATNAAGSNTVTLPSKVGNLFFRLGP